MTIFGPLTCADNNVWFSPGMSDILGFPRDMDSIPGSRRSPRGGNGNLLQNSCRENSIDRDTWWAAVHGVAKS